MKKFGRILTILLVAAVFIGTFAYLFQRSRPKEIKYEELAPEMGTISKSTVVTGKIQPRDEVNVKAQISGIVAELYKEAGQTVEKNEVIAKLKVIPEMSQLSSAQSRVRLSEVNLKQAQTNYDRQKNLFDQQLVSAEAFEQVAQALKQAQEEYAASVESLEIIRDGVSSSNKSGSSTLVRSSVAGLILDIPVKVGNTVINSNTFNDGTTIATVADMNDLIFDGNIDETEVGRVHIGLPVRITVGALQDVAIDAALEYISPKATESGGTNLFGPGRRHHPLRLQRQRRNRAPARGERDDPARKCHPVRGREYLRLCDGRQRLRAPRRQDRHLRRREHRNQGRPLPRREGPRHPDPRRKEEVAS